MRRLQVATLPVRTMWIAFLCWLFCNVSFCSKIATGPVQTMWTSFLCWLSENVSFCSKIAMRPVHHSSVCWLSFKDFCDTSADFVEIILVLTHLQYLFLFKDGYETSADYVDIFPVSPNEIIQEGDILFMSGGVKTIVSLHRYVPADFKWALMFLGVLTWQACSSFVKIKHDNARLSSIGFPVHSSVIIVLFYLEMVKIQILWRISARSSVLNCGLNRWHYSGKLCVEPLCAIVCSSYIALLVPDHIPCDRMSWLSPTFLINMHYQ